jgi:hypothetical protein
MGKGKKRATKIMLLRHAEKPAKDGLPQGVTLEGEAQHRNRCKPAGGRGRVRSQNVFATATGKIQNILAGETAVSCTHRNPYSEKGAAAVPNHFTACREDLHSHQHALRKIRHRNVVAEAVSRRGVVLMCWQREYIPGDRSVYFGGLTSAVPATGLKIVST